MVLGLGYPLLMTGVGQVAFHDQANGSIVQLQGKDVGSSLIGQEFKGAQWFQSRPSAGVATTRWPRAAPTSARTRPTC